MDASLEFQDVCGVQRSADLLTVSSDVCAVQKQAANDAQAVLLTPNLQVRPQVSVFSPASKGPEIIISSPEKKLLGKLEEDYERQAEDLRATGQANEGMFSRLQIIKALTPEVLARALRIEKLIKGATPKGLLVPDNDRHEKVTAINDNKVPGQTCDTDFYEKDNQELWNGGEEWPEQAQWLYKIFQGEQDVEDRTKIIGSNYDRSRMWVDDIEESGLEVLTGADSYLAAMRQALVDGKPLDPNTFTVLNAKHMIKPKAHSSYARVLFVGVAFGCWNSAQVSLNHSLQVYYSDKLRVRASMGVDVPKV